MPKKCKFREATYLRITFYCFSMAICYLGYRFDWHINLHSREGHKFIITAIEFTTKWMEVILKKSVTQDKFISFLIKNNITSFGVPQRLITENGPNFKGKYVKAFFKKFHITQTFSFIYYPQGNGQFEATNNTLKCILAKTWDSYKRDSHEQLPYVL